MFHFDAIYSFYLEDDEKVIWADVPIMIPLTVRLFIAIIFVTIIAIILSVLLGLLVDVLYACTISPTPVVFTVIITLMLVTKNSCYVITNNRFLIFSAVHFSPIEIVEFADVDILEVIKDDNGAGCIIYKYKIEPSGQFRNRKVPIGFMNIHNVEKLENLILDLLPPQCEFYKKSDRLKNKKNMIG